MSKEEYNQLVDKLNAASEAYYNGKETMSNKEFDDLMDQLNQFEREEGIVRVDSPSKTVGATAVDFLPKFKHPYPALSLDKTKNVDEMVKKFEDGILASDNPDNDGVVVMWKEDGSTVQIYYKDGKLEHLVTRGNGEIGSEITHNASVIEGLPLIIPVKGEVVVRGEALMSYEEFNKINSMLPEDQQYKNPRNLAAASISMLDPAEVAERHIVVKAFNLVKFDPQEQSYKYGHRNTFSGRLQLLDSWGFNTVERFVCPVYSLSEVIETMSGQVVNYPYPVDGLVVAMDNYNYAKDLKGTEHHPHIMNGYAFKWSDETAETVLREIEWSPSRTGLLNPVAVFDPVELEGTTVQRASIHNVSVMCNMNLHVGDRITVLKSNKIIPQIYKNLDIDKHTPYTMQELPCLVGDCPTCGTSSFINISPEGIMTAMCPNPDCPEKMIGKLAHFCERDCMNIEGMSEETIKKLVELKYVKEYADFFRLDEEPTIAYIPGFGKTSWQNMCKAAEKARTTDFVRFITAMSIPNIGKGQAKTLLKYISENYDELCNLTGYAGASDSFDAVLLLFYLTDIGFDFSVIDGFGKILADSLSNWISVHMPYTESTPETRVLQYLTFTDKKVDRSRASNSGAISGKSFCITGKLVTFNNRQELVAKIESHGGKWVDSVSSRTDYLINNDVTSSSGKNKKAKELNIPIISEETFLQMLN